MKKISLILITLLLLILSGCSNNSVPVIYSVINEEGTITSQPNNDDNKIENEDSAKSSDKYSEEDIEKALQGTWTVSNGSFSFNNGDLVVLSQGQQLPGTYKINVSKNQIDGTFKVSNGNVSIVIPYEFDGSNLKIYNSAGQQLKKQ